MSTSPDQAAIEKVLYAYGDSLNAGDASAAIALYAADGVVMPTNGPTSTGPTELRAAYEHFFQLMKFDVKFHIEEVVVSGDYAFARTHSAGTTVARATGQTSAEENRELYVLQKIGGEWKIARYMFNKTK
jgi:uncharacterized protein (TIGR02246 family)